MALKQSCCRKNGFKEKNSNDRRENRKTGKTQEDACVDAYNILKIKLSTEARCFSLCEVKLNVVVCGAS